MNTQEHLTAIRAKCVELLAKAEQRTPGPWYGVIPTGDTQRKDSWLEISNDLKNNRATEQDLSFLASCAGPAEAGWSATIAAIDKGLECESWDVHAQQMYIRHDAEEILSAIITAWPEELLK